MTQKRFKVKKGDLVQIMVGKDKGRKGVVSKVLLDKGHVFVDGMREVVRHIRPSAQHPTGRIVKNMSLNISNVALVDPKTNEPGRVQYFIDNGEKVRKFKSTGSLLPVKYVK